MTPEQELWAELVWRFMGRLTPEELERTGGRAVTEERAMTPQQEFLADLVEATGLDVSVVPRAVSYQVIVHDARRTHLGIVTLREDSGRVWVIRSGDVAARLDLADPRLTERLREALLAASSA